MFFFQSPRNPVLRDPDDATHTSFPVLKNPLPLYVCQISKKSIQNKCLFYMDFIYKLYKISIHTAHTQIGGRIGGFFRTGGMIVYFVQI